MYKAEIMKHEIQISGIQNTDNAIRDIFNSKGISFMANAKDELTKEIAKYFGVTVDKLQDNLENGYIYREVKPNFEKSEKYEIIVTFFPQDVSTEDSIGVYSKDKLEQVETVPLFD